MNKEFFKKNRAKLMENIADNSIVVLFAGKPSKKTADEAYPFTPNRNFYYATGIDEDSIILVMTKIKGRIEENLLIQKADPIMEKWVGKTISAEAAKEVSGIDTVGYIEELEGRVHRILTHPNLQNLYLDLERDNYGASLTQSQLFARDVIEKYPYVIVKNIFPLFVQLRMVKEEVEIEQIKEAIRITKSGIENLIKNAKAGMKEYEMEAYFDFVLKSNGIKDYAFKTICASGENGTVLHYSANNAEAKEGDLVLLDLGAQYGYYSADISRTFPVSGKFTERQREIYNIVLKAQMETMKVIKAGVPFAEINKTTRTVLAEGLKRIGLIKNDSELSNYYYHGVSHFLGLDTHDVGHRDIELKPGMVLTVEPGLYIAEEGIGIRIEDDVIVTESGCENLSPQIIKTVEEIEAFMAIR
jgi:Xaa-Pro aminopeptidase